MFTWVSDTALHDADDPQRTATPGGRARGDRYAAPVVADDPLDDAALDGLALDDTALAAWLSEARVDLAGAERRRERWLRQRAEDEATLHGALVDAVERGVPIRLRLRPTGWERLTVRGVAAGFCIVDTATGPGVVAVAAIGALDLGGLGPPAGDRSDDGGLVDLALGEALALLLDERPEVAVWTLDAADPVRGELVAVGSDVLTVRAPERTLVVPLAALARLVVLG